MNTNSLLTKELKDKTYRDAYVASQIRVGLPFQVRGLRKQRNLSQAELANLAGMAQPRISEIEKPGERSLNIETLLRVASGLDVALQVSFVSFSKLVDQSENFDPDYFQVPDFETEIAQIESAQAAQLADAHKAALWDSNFSFSGSGIGLKALAKGATASSGGVIGIQGGGEHSLQGLIGRTQTEIPRSMTQPPQTFKTQVPESVTSADSWKSVSNVVLIRKEAQPECSCVRQAIA